MFFFSLSLSLSLSFFLSCARILRDLLQVLGEDTDCAALLLRAGADPRLPEGSALGEDDGETPLECCGGGEYEGAAAAERDGNAMAALLLSGSP